jgi:DNA-binding transcriptional regulator YiaG
VSQANRTFSERLFAVRMSKRKNECKTLSQLDAALLFEVTLSTYRNWESGRSLPDPRCRKAIDREWPEVFSSVKVGINSLPT